MLAILPRQPYCDFGQPAFFTWNAASPPLTTAATTAVIGMSEPVWWEPSPPHSALPLQLLFIGLTDSTWGAVSHLAELGTGHHSPPPTHLYFRWFVQYPLLILLYVYIWWFFTYQRILLPLLSFSQDLLPNINYFPSFFTVLVSSIIYYSLTMWPSYPRFFCMLYVMYCTVNTACIHYTILPITAEEMYLVSTPNYRLPYEQFVQLRNYAI